jgi:radical SAM protein with 4Fe4S-binding SPASM domain
MITTGFILKNLYYLLFRKELHFEFDRIPLIADKISKKKMLNLFVIAFNRLFPITKALGFPYMAHISPSGICNLDCPLCPANDPRTQAKTFLSFETFKKFIDEAGDYLIYVILWSWGEPFLNPDIYKMIEYAREKNILTVSSTNINQFSREDASKLIESGLDALIIALDGITQKTYVKYRTGGDVQKVIENTGILVEERKKLKAEKPFINLRMVISKENEFEIEDIKHFARDVGVDMVSFKAFATKQLGFENPEFDKKYAPVQRKYRWYKYLKDFSTDRNLRKFRCKFPWTKPTLFADGEILSCEYDFRYESPFGNINTQSFKNIWFSEKVKAFRKQFRKDRNQFLFCRDCVFDYTLINGCVIEREILKK